MKKYLLYLFLSTLFLQTSLFAQQLVVVSGTAIMNGSPMVGVPIVTEYDGPPLVSDTVYTDSMGFYSDTILIQTTQGIVYVQSPCDVDTVFFNPNQIDYTVDIDCSTGLGNCVAAFGTNQTGNTVTFSSFGVGNLTYIWDFGDGNFSNLATPAHTYATAGNYNVCLTVIDSLAACSDNMCQVISVGNTGGGSCYAQYSYFSLQGDTYQFLDSSNVGNSASYFWDFGNGTTSTLQNPTATLTPGVYQVCLTVLDSTAGANCVDTYCQTLTLGNAGNCTADFDIMQTPIGGFAFAARSQSPTQQYVWDLGDGTNATGSSINHNYNSPGAYTVCLSVVDSANNCFDQQCQLVVVPGGNNCISSFSYVDLGNSQYQFFADTGLASFYFWDFGNGDSAVGPNPQHTFPGPGVYNVCLFVSEANCQDFSCQTIVIGGGGNNTCIADFDALPLPNGNVQFLNLSQGLVGGGQNFNSYWSFGDGTSSNSQNPTHTYANGADSAFVCLTISSSNTCTDTICKWILIVPDSTGFGCDAAFAAHNTGSGVVAFNSLCPSPNLSYSWDFGDGNTDNSSSPVHTYSSPGVYYVCLQVNDSLINCNATFCDSVYVSNYGTGPGACQVVADFTYQDLGNGSFSFTELSSSFGIPGSAAGLNFFWIFSDSTTSTDPNPTHSFIGPGPYGACLTVADSSGACVTSACQVIGTTNPNSGFHVSGAVFADSQLVDNGVVYLIQHDTTAAGGTLTAVDSTYLNQSFYTFFNVQPGTYLVKAALLPASPFYQNYMPTYLGDEMLWNNATSVVVANQNQILPIISLVPGNNPGGPGFIGGAISQGANKVLDGLADVSILLMTEQGQAVNHTVSDAEGEYEFRNLAYGTYHLYVEITGKLSEKWIVSLDAQGERFEKADFRVMEAEVLASGTTGINDFSFGNLLNVYPNPTQGIMNLEVEMTEQKDLRISVMSLVGQKLIEKTVPQVIGSRKISLELNELMTGTYLLMIEAEGESLNRLIIKK